MRIDEFIYKKGIKRLIPIRDMAIIMPSKSKIRCTCDLCNTKFMGDITQTYFCKDCLKRQTIPQTFLEYSKLVRRLTEKVYKKYKQFVNPNDFSRSLYHLDHYIPIRECFAKRIIPEMASDVRNLKMLPAKDNISKSTKRFVNNPFYYGEKRCW